MAEKYAEVILPLPLQESYTYRIPPHLEARALPGRRAIVSFGTKKTYSALITGIHETPSFGYNIKELETIPDDQPLAYEINLELWRWIARYYICPLGEVMKAALPSGLKLESTTFILRNPVEQNQELTLAGQHYLRAIGEKKITVQELARLMGEHFSYRMLNKLIRERVLRVEEKVGQKFKTKLQSIITLHPEIKDRERWIEALGKLARAGKQKELALRFAQKCALFSEDQKTSIPKKVLLSELFSEATLIQLVNKKILKVEHETVSRLPEHYEGLMSLNMLSGPQEKALEEIQKQFSLKPVVLLHGITASGKTEVYFHLIDETCRQGRQVLYLVPEIGLTPQIITRIEKAFGHKSGVYHSGMNDPERVETWYKVLAFKDNRENGYQIILGTRSAIFLPFSNLGLIIVDEEHDTSYKQSDPSPRYNARDSAVILGIQHKAPVLLGSATPSLESYHNATSGKYGLVSLPCRFGSASLPEIVVSDVLKARKQRAMKSLLTPALFREITVALESGNQVILFQNRRGFAAFLECPECGHIPRCIHCDVSLTWHKSRYQLTCHYCGWSIKNPESCPQCGSKEMKPKGSGTEKAEQEIAELFPSARIDRMDTDSVRSVKAIETVIRKMEQKKTDILIGTQMVTKGLDLENVTLVGVLNADNLLNYPDFRAFERAFQLMHQVSGRAGRKDKKGTVVIQTSQPDHPVIGYIRDHNYEGFFNELTEERKLFKYPPWYRLTKIVIRHREAAPLDRISGQLAEMLRSYPDFTVLGPEAPLIGKIRQWLIKEIWVKTPRNKKSGEIQDALREPVDKIRKLPGHGGALISIDVDPL